MYPREYEAGKQLQVSYFGFHVVTQKYDKFDFLKIVMELCNKSPFDILVSLFRTKFMDQLQTNSDAEIDEFGLREKTDALTLWISQQISIPSISEKMLELFLHSCMYDVDATRTTIQAYYNLRIESPYYFSDRDPSAKCFQILIEKGYAFLLPGTTDEGYRVIMAGYFLGDGSDCVFKDSAKRFMMLIDMWLSKLDICDGYLIVLECKNTAFSHYTSVSFDALKKLCVYFQEALPVRLKGLYFINISAAVNMLLTMAHPFLSRKINDMLHKYTLGNDDYTNTIPRRMLPMELGGEAGTIQELHDAAQNELVEYTNWFREQDQIIKELAEKQSPREGKGVLKMLF